MNKLRVFLSLVSLLLFLVMFYFAFKDIEKIKEILISSNKIYFLLSSIFF
ncbi:MAG: hypothetical protein N2504_03200 [candidate division WOR-3 bacterium]|nr:hypothetical protein [candidate division WOR-3 bacterium]MCX7947577.1 hypothetical protein [candidate division WOR-3 bacterium]MDW8150462.1 hypothetical protein [candidate division WOR-3 bacterium]